MSYKDCFAEMKDDEDEVAECIHCLKKHGETVYFREDLKNKEQDNNYCSREINRYLVGN